MKKIDRDNFKLNEMKSYFNLIKDLFKIYKYITFT